MTKTKEANQLPFFVYGTLMKGCRLFEFIGNYTELIENATLDGFSLFDINEIYPFMCRVQSDKPVKGQLMYVKDEHYIDRLDFLDILEKDYSRIKVMVNTERGQVCAWAYVSEKSFDDESRIKSNSWIDYITKKGELDD